VSVDCLSVYLSYLSVCLSVCPSVCFFVCLSVCLYVVLSICLFVFLYICISVCLSVCLSACPSICHSVCLSVYRVCLSICPSVLSVCLSVCLVYVQRVCGWVCPCACVFVCICVCVCECLCVGAKYIYMGLTGIPFPIRLSFDLAHPTGWQRCKGCLKLQVSFRKRATNYRGFSRKETCNDKASYASSPPCTPFQVSFSKALSEARDKKLLGLFPMKHGKRDLRAFASSLVTSNGIPFEIGCHPIKYHILCIYGYKYIGIQMYIYFYT